MKKKALSDEAKAGIGAGVGLAALAAAAAGAYYLYGSKKSAKNRKAVKSWMLRAKAEVMDEIEKLRDVTEPAYRDAVRKVMKKYEEVKGMDLDELAGLAASMQAHWKDIKAEIESVAVPRHTKPTPRKRKA